jgi:MYXO-CTERM domain-containing protein
MSAADEAGRARIVLAILGIMLLGFGALALHRRIAKHIDLIGKL